MKSSQYSSSSLIVIALAFISLCSSAVAEMREWSSSKGKKITAEAIFVGETIVVFKTDKGKEIATPISGLSNDDIKFLKELKAAKEKQHASPDLNKKTEPETEPTAKPTAAPKAGLLPLLADGKGKGFHAYYEGEKYIAKVNAKGVLTIQYKEADGAILPKWSIRIYPDARRITEAKTISYKFQKILKHGNAQMNPAEVRYTHQRDGDIKCEVVYEFTPDGYTTWTRSDESPETPPEMIHRLVHTVSKPSKISTDKSFLKKMKLKQEAYSGNDKKVDFLEEDRLKGDTKRYEMTGPILAKTKLRVDRGSAKEAKLLLTQYPGCPLESGFSFILRKDDCKTRDHQNEKATFTFK